MAPGYSIRIVSGMPATSRANNERNQPPVWRLASPRLPPLPGGRARPLLGFPVAKRVKFGASKSVNSGNLLGCGAKRPCRSSGLRAKESCFCRFLAGRSPNHRTCQNGAAGRYFSRMSIAAQTVAEVMALPEQDRAYLARQLDRKSVV